MTGICESPVYSNPPPFIWNLRVPNIRSAIDKHWNILKINTELAETFKEKPFVAYRKNQNLKDFIGQTTIENNKVLRKKTQQKGKCRPCWAKTNNLCCRQIQSTSLFTNQQTKRYYTIFQLQKHLCIYLLECRKCHIQILWNTNYLNNMTDKMVVLLGFSRKISTPKLLLSPKCPQNCSNPPPS